MTALVAADPADELAPGPELWPGSPRAISWSQISRHWDCPESYRLAYRTDAERRPSGAMLAGSAVHQAILIGEEEGWWWDDELWRGSPAPIVALVEQAFAVAFGVLIAGGRWLDDEGGWSWRPPAIDVDGVRLEGEAALRWGGRLVIVEDEDGNRLQKRGPGGRLLWTCPGLPEPYEADKPVERPRGKGGKMLKDLAVWEKAREDLRWWARNGPLMVRRAGALRRQDRDQGTEVALDAAERRLELRIPLGDRIVPVVVILDLAFTHAGGEPRIRDYKSGTMIQPLQLAFYAWALRQLEDGHPLAWPVEVGEIADLRANGGPAETVKEYDLRPWLPLIPGFVEQHMAMVAAEVAAGEVFELRPSSFCPSCAVRDFCRYGQTLPERAE